MPQQSPTIIAEDSGSRFDTHGYPTGDGSGSVPRSVQQGKVLGEISVTGFNMGTGAVLNYVLSSDANGNASWVSPASIGDSILAIANTWTATQTFANIVVSGVKTIAGDATIVSAGTSPYTYTNSSSSNQQIFVQGGTISAITYNPAGGTAISLSAFVDNILILRPTDTLTITYSVAPTINTVQL